MKRGDDLITWCIKRLCVSCSSHCYDKTNLHEEGHILTDILRDSPSPWHLKCELLAHNSADQEAEKRGYLQSSLFCSFMDPNTWDSISHIQG